LLLDGWECASARPGNPPDAWLPAVLPGDVRLSLLAAGRISDPLVGGQLDESRWVADHDWLFRRTLPPSPHRRTLVFKGIDYQAEMTFNGQLLGRFTGMFSERRVAIPPAGGTITVRCSAPSRLPRPRLGALERLTAWALRSVLGGELFPPRLATLKCQMTYGWDFAPALPTVGLWDEVVLHTTGPAAIAAMAVRARPASDGALVTVDLEVDLAEAAELAATATVRDELGTAVAETTERWRARAGASRRRLRFAVPRVAWWEPWERGRPALYRIDLRLDAEGVLSDHRSERFGLRTVAMGPPAGGGRAAPADDWVRLVVNGRTLFVRGANWVPNDALLGRLREDDYRFSIEQAKAAGVNLLRVWGGGLREREAFYRVCDELGMLVWQEFPFSVAFFDHFPRDRDYAAFVEEECRGIVRAVRNHPSVVVWCGGNEFNPDRNRPVVDALARAVAVEDGTRPFRAASPGAGERHNWRVWHGKANVADYRLERAALVSEFGLQAAPVTETLEVALPDDPTPGPAWEMHSAQLDKLQRYAQAASNDVASFVAATQRAQANGLQVAVEHLRRRRGATTGAIIWQLNEPWPAISWSLIDYHRRPKQAFRRLREWYAPVLVSLDYPLRSYQPGDELAGTLWVVNDTLAPLDRLEVVATVGGHEVLRRSAVAAPSAATCLGRVSFRLPSVADLVLRLSRHGTVLGHTCYDLAWHDPGRIRWVDAVRDWLTWRVLH
jgi:beta-mannosidase